ncbi:MAG: flagellar hook-basal body protein [Dehalococcoidia bacterium]|nr:flagellar hook-basal body protein [Dehalococcoidia bacterium]
MIKGLYAAFNAMEAAWQYQDVLANNVANATTAGFKREVAAVESFADVLLSRQAPVPAPLPARIQGVVGQIGTGAFIAEFATDFSPGALQATGNELDLATTDGFFVVASANGQIYYTRDGRFGRDADGALVTSHGYYVLDDAGNPITLPPTPVRVESDGTVTADSQLLARLQIRDFAPTALTRAGEAYFTASDAGEPIDGGVRQGVLEMSNASLIDDMTTLLAVQRAFQASQTVIARLDATLDAAAGQVGQFGR